MADQRIQIPIKITDPTTPAQEAAVDASNNLQVILASNTGVDIGDVDVTSVVPGTAATNLGKAIDSAVGGTDTGVAALAVRDDALGGITPAEDDYTSLLVDANGALWCVINGTVTVSATQLDIDSLNKDDDEVLVWANTAKDGTGTDYVPLVDADGHLQVDVLSGGGTDSPTTPATSTDSSVALAAGSQDTLTTGEVGTQELWQVTISSSVAVKGVIQYEENTVTTDLATVFCPPGGTVIWTTPHRDFASITASAGVDAFNVVVDNLDTSEAADIYAAFQHSAS